MTDENALPIPDPERLIERLADQVNVEIHEYSALIGIHAGGSMVLKRLQSILAESIAAQQIPVGVLDVGMHRDDYATRGLKRTVQPTDIQFDIKDKHIILIDDVFYTGRTARAAMNEIFDFGRPASITLAVLVNRGGAQLPIQPQIAAYATQLDSTHHLQLSQDDAGALMLECGHMQSESTS